jgi:serine/threonine protein kinase
MSLAPGTRLGPYEIQAPLGIGGMGEVNRARDTKLNRDVAIKVLADLFARDPEWLARFEQEAQLLASLNHPHIAQVYGFEESAETSSNQTRVRALVMERDGRLVFQGSEPDGAYPAQTVRPETGRTDHAAHRTACR